MKSKWIKWMEEYIRIIEGRYQKLYGNENINHKIDKIKKDLIIKAVMIGAAFIILLGSGLLGESAQKGFSQDKSGNYILVKRPEKGKASIVLNATVKAYSEKGVSEKDVQLTVEPVGGEKKDEPAVPLQREKDKFNDQINKALLKINQNTSQLNIKLPEKLESGERLVWQEPTGSSTPIYFIGLVIVGVLIYKNRFSIIEREEDNAKTSIIRELPEFINKIVLLLNAGVVLNTAFVKVMEDKRALGKTESYFYEQMDLICKRIEETNGSMHHELRSFSKRSGVRELIRVSNIICDNIYKGAGLVEKLQRENEMLWFSRKQQSEEKGRLAETKLTLPLVMLLLVLIMITIAPALIEI